MSPIENANYNYENDKVKLPVDELLISNCNYENMTENEKEQYKLWASMSRENYENKLIKMIEERITKNKTV